MSQTYCWCDCRIVIVVDGPEGRFTTTTEHPFARIGSDASADVVLKGKDIPPRAFYLHATPEGIFCVSLAKSRSLFHGWTEPQQLIPIGPYRMEVRLAGSARGAPKPELDPDAKGSAAPPLPTVMVSLGEGVIGQVVIRRRLTLVGRGRPCNVRVDSHSVSGYHCALYWDQHALWIIDLLSKNGTVLGGDAVTVAQLLPGREATLGRIKLGVLPMPNDNPPRPDAPTSLSLTIAQTERTGGTEGPSRDPAAEREELDRRRRACDDLEKAAAETEAANQRRLAEIEAAAAELRSERARWQEQARKMAGDWNQQVQSLQTQIRQVEQMRSSLGDERQEFERQRAAWTAERNQAEAEDRRRRQVLDREQQALELQRDKWQSERRRLEQERADAAQRPDDGAARDHESPPPISASELPPALPELLQFKTDDLAPTELADSFAGSVIVDAESRTLPSGPSAALPRTLPAVGVTATASSPADADFEGLRSRLTGQLIEFDRRQRWRRWIKILVLGIILVIALGGLVFLGQQYAHEYLYRVIWGFLAISS